MQSNDEWIVHGVPTFFGLLVYGFGLGFLAPTRAEGLVVRFAA
jgi:hypothetical protein